MKFLPLHSHRRLPCYQIPVQRSLCPISTVVLIEMYSIILVVLDLPPNLFTIIRTTIHDRVLKLNLVY